MGGCWVGCDSVYNGMCSLDGGFLLHSSRASVSHQFLSALLFFFIFLYRIA